MESVSRPDRCLFVYGTLMDDALVCELTGRRFSKESAVLPGYRKVVPDGGYAYIVPDADAVVEGFVLVGVDDEALRIFDRYEDERHLYQRVDVTVTVGNRTCRSMVYEGSVDALDAS
jgi:gamma-glutamylcyclotransferase (GGCT)/AIG2-like uncharacterized protein YtfP